jgi:hypothetical protein
VGRAGVLGATGWWGGVRPPPRAGPDDQALPPVRETGIVKIAP